MSTTWSFSVNKGAKVALCFSADTGPRVRITGVARQGVVLPTFNHLLAVKKILLLLLLLCSSISHSLSLVVKYGPRYKVTFATQLTQQDVYGLFLNTCSSVPLRVASSRSSEASDQKLPCYRTRVPVAWQHISPCTQLRMHAYILMCTRAHLTSLRPGNPRLVSTHSHKRDCCPLNQAFPSLCPAVAVTAFSSQHFVAY